MATCLKYRTFSKEKGKIFVYKSTANIAIAKSMVCLIGIYLGRCPEKKELLFRALPKLPHYPMAVVLDMVVVVDMVAVVNMVVLLVFMVVVVFMVVIVFIVVIDRTERTKRTHRTDRIDRIDRTDRTDRTDKTDITDI